MEKVQLTKLLIASTTPLVEMYAQYVPGATDATHAVSAPAYEPP